MNDELVKHIVDELIRLRTVSNSRRKTMELIVVYMDSNKEEVKKAISEFNISHGCILPYTACNGASCGDEFCTSSTLFNAKYNANCQYHKDVFVKRRKIRRNRQ